MNSPRLATLAAAILLLGTAGCSNAHPVTGKVTFEDGAVLDRGLVIMESTGGESRISGQGNIEKDGTFAMGTDKPGNGLPIGHYRVLVLPPDLNEKQREAGMTDPIDGKWQRFETSGIETDVKKGENQFDIKVSKPGKGKKK